MSHLTVSHEQLRNFCINYHKLDCCYHAGPCKQFLCSLWRAQSLCILRIGGNVTVAVTVMVTMEVWMQFDQLDNT